MISHSKLLNYAQITILQQVKNSTSYPKLAISHQNPQFCFIVLQYFYIILKIIKRYEPFINDFPKYKIQKNSKTGGFL